jgi:hypothetical protein
MNSLNILGFYLFEIYNIDNLKNSKLDCSSCCHHHQDKTKNFFDNIYNIYN